MHTRQRGAAHIPIMFFIILLVMFLGAVGWAYSVTSDNTTLRTDNLALKSDNLGLNGQLNLCKHYIEDAGRVFEQPGKYEGRSEVNKKDVYADKNLDGFANLMNPADVKKKIDSFTQTLGLSSAKGLDDLFSAVVTMNNQKSQRIKDIEAERDKALADKQAMEASYNTATNEHSQAATTWRTTLEQANAAYVASKSQLETNVNSLTAGIVEANDKLAAEKEQRAAEKKNLQNEIGKLQMHNTALVSKDKLRNPIDEADGRILVAKAGLQTAYIDLGRKDMLQRGTVFRIKNKNSNAVKGYATVTRVEQDKAEVLLSDVVNPLTDAVREGDLLYNELYSPNGNNRRTIFLLGRFSYPYNKPQLEMLVKNLGNTVVTKMGPGVDTVILGDKPVNEANDGFSEITESPEFKEANNLGVEFVPLRKIRDLLRLD